MSLTPHSQGNQDFTDKAHLCARRNIYPDLFGVSRDRLDFVELPTEEAQKLDYEQGIDKTLDVFVRGLHGKLRFTVQERFRRPNYASYQDMTITEFNHNSNMLGELYKIHHASLMLYGYYNPATERFIEAIACWVSPLLASITSERIRQSTRLNTRSNQSFFCFKFDDLEQLSGVVAYRKRWTHLSDLRGETA